MQDVDIQKMLEGNQGALLELLQWFFKTLGDHGPLSDYDPKGRRAVSKHGGCDRIPRFGASEAAFKRWAMKGVQHFDYVGVPPFSCGYDIAEVCVAVQRLL